MQVVAERRRVLELPRAAWLAEAVALAALTACALADAALLRIGIDDLDEGYFLQQADRIYRYGQLPFRDFESLYTPGLAYLNAGLFWLHGGISVVGPRLISMGARLGLVVLLYALTRPLVRRPIFATLPGLVVLTAFDATPAHWEPHPAWLATLFAVLAAWCLGRGTSPRWLLGAGAACALAYLFKQNTGALMLAAVLLRGLWRWRESRRELLLPLLSFGTLTALWLVPLVVAMHGDVAPLGGFVGAVNQAGLFAPPEWTLLVALACVAGGLYVRQDAGWLLVAAMALFLTQLPRMDTEHLAWSAPLLLVLGAAALDRLPGRVAVLALAFVAFLAAPTLSARLASVSEARTPFAGLEVAQSTADELDGVVADVQTRARPGEPIFVYPSSPLVYVLAERPNATRFDHLNPGAATALELEQVIADLQRANVQTVVISEFWTQAWGQSGANEPLQAWIDHNFVQVARYGSYRVLRHI